MPRKKLSALAAPSRAAEIRVEEGQMRFIAVIRRATTITCCPGDSGGMSTCDHVPTGGHGVKAE